MAEMQKVLTGQSICTTDMGTDGFQSSGDEFAPHLGREVSQDSAGSLLHGQGACKPCAWFWKPQGCRNGKDCLHCHLCPCSEIKARKKKLFARQKEDAELKSAESTATTPLPPSWPISLPPPGLTPTSEDEQLVFSEESPGPTETESKGSELHRTGDCKPCAWFWHAKGCSNGSECTFCHICPAGELKARRKLKVLKLRQESALESLQQISQDPSLPGAPSAVMHLASLWEMQAATAKLEADLSMDRSPVKVMHAESWPSLGSREHGTGDCRPCAWFWKKGCLNGRECLHCHLCPEGELRRKKKEAAKLRSVPKDVRQITDTLALQQHIIEQQQQRLVDLQLQLQLQQQLMVATAMTPSFSTEPSTE